MKGITSGIKIKIDKISKRFSINEFPEAYDDSYLQEM